MSHRHELSLVTGAAAQGSSRAALEAAKAEPRARIHSFHRYFGKLIPAIPRFAIRELTKPGDLVLDPFCGSGTTIVEAVLAGRRAIGLDLNPLAALVTKAKTTPLDIPVALRTRDRVLAAYERDGAKPAGHTPFVPNMDHWFRPEVQRDLAILLGHIRRVRHRDVRDFLLACFSAMLRDVSNADPRHIFPGYSKRLRAIDAAEGREIHVFDRFRTVTDRRARFVADFHASRLDGCRADVFCADSRCIPAQVADVDLIVTNPPYISSIRYLETMKLEMYWLGFVDSREAYFALDRRGVGTERLRVASGGRDIPVAPGGARMPRPPQRGAVRDAPLLPAEGIARQLLDAGQPKMAAVVARYFADMSEALAEMARVLRRGGHLVMKISDSHVRGIDVPTHALLIELAEQNGLRLLEQFTDEIRSRSLLTKRNWYSGMIAHDWILIFRR